MAESLVLEAKMLLTGNLRSIDHIKVNKWTILSMSPKRCWSAGACGASAGAGVSGAPPPSGRYGFVPHSSSARKPAGMPTTKRAMLISRKRA